MKAEGLGTIISKGFSFDEGSRSMNTGHSDRISRGERIGEAIKRQDVNVRSRMSEDRSNS